MKNNMLIIHGGAPTAVINASLYGAVRAAAESGEVGAVYGAKGGSLGAMRGEFIRLDTIPESQLRLLLQTPSSAIGTSRDHLEPEDYARMAEAIEAGNIRWVLYTGGNGSMEACGKLAEACKGKAITVGIPKTIDNDIAETDHAPGFGSAARYLAATLREICADVRGLPIHVSVVEAMGRNAGWLAAAACLAGTPEEGGPHMILTPEIAFDEDAFLTRVEALGKTYGGVVVVASEGLKNKTGSPIVQPVFEVDRSVYFGDVSAHLAGLVIRRLGIKARSEKPGIAGRASIAWQSTVDRDEAVLCGQQAVLAALEGQSEVMIGLKRAGERGSAYAVTPYRVPIRQVMLNERLMPDAYFAEDGMGVTPAYREWCAPLVGESFPPFARLAP